MIPVGIDDGCNVLAGLADSADEGRPGDIGGDGNERCWDVVELEAHGGGAVLEAHGSDCSTETEPDPPEPFEWGTYSEDADSELAAAIELSLSGAGLFAGVPGPPEPHHPRSAVCPFVGCAARLVELPAGRRTLASALAAAGFDVLGAGGSEAASLEHGAAEVLVDEAAAVAALACSPGDEFGPGAGPDPAQAWRSLRLEGAPARPDSGQRWWCLCRTRHRHPRPDDRREGGPDPAQALRLPRRRRVDS